MIDLIDAKSLRAELETLRDTSGTLTGALVAIAGEKLVETTEHRELWGMFTCREVEALANVFRRFGLTDDADKIVAAHAEGDEEGDLHYPHWK